jgi:hypothetical protein
LLRLDFICFSSYGSFLAEGIDMCYVYCLMLSYCLGWRVRKKIGVEE